MGTTTRAEQFLSTFARASGMSQDGKNWLINCVDPNHDRQVKLNGYPDTCNSASLVQRIKQTFTIAAPGGTTPGTNWDLQIVNTPFLNTLPFTLGQCPGTTTPINLTTNFVQSRNPFSQQASYGGLTFIAGPAGTAQQLSVIANLNTGTPSTSTGYVVSNPLPSAYGVGTVRVIASAFEVCNTTAELYRQGSVLTYRQPVPEYETSSTYTIIGPTSGSIPTTTFTTDGIVTPCPPTSQSTAMLLPGSQQWEAKEGCYVVSALNASTIPQQNELFVQPIMVENTSAGGYTGFYIPTYQGLTGIYPSSGTGVASFQYAYGFDNFWTKFDQAGAYFAGLSSQTTLTITWTVDVERFPTEIDRDLIVIATPSPKYDPVALEAYALIMQEMPTGVRFKDNGLGDWFMGAVSKVRDVVMPLLRGSAQTSPAAAALVGVHDLITKKGGGKKGGKKKERKNAKGGLKTEKFLNNGSNAKNGKMFPNGKGKAWRKK